jgi:hypothetical protein
MVMPPQSRLEHLKQVTGQQHLRHIQRETLKNATKFRMEKNQKMKITITAV